jgi:uncharacterized 2Fe-2S/4Fe-4S cluster protein (DUF4445 family)
MAGIEIAAPCNGRGHCGKCRVRIFDAALPVNQTQDHLSPEEITAGIRLACQVEAGDGMVVNLPEDHSLDARILEGERIDGYPVAPAARVEVIEARHHLRYEDEPAVVLSGWQEGYVPKGIAVDLGTTTLVVTLMDLQKGGELATASAANPQSRFGYDVISRIQHGSTSGGLTELTDSIAGGLNGLVADVCRTSGTHPHEIVDTVIGGNTTMLQLAAGIDPTPLGRVPFTVGIDSGRTYSAKTFRLEINPQARVYIPPVAHAFVGADISAGLLSVDFFQETAPVLFMDLGTNGEIGLIANGQKLVTSTAAGPAFEGMGISQGMRAAPGAIETVWANGNYLGVRAIDDTPARGICGSGIMDVMACLIRFGAVDAGGRFEQAFMDNRAPGPLSDRYAVVRGTDAVRLSDRVYFTQKDIRQFQLAKSAVRTGAEMLLATAGIAAAKLDRIIVAGGFGHHLREESLRTIGILPGGFTGKIDFAGNSCRTGCALLLADATSRRRLEAYMQAVSHLAIAEEAAFQARFIQNLSL